MRILTLLLFILSISCSKNCDKREIPSTKVQLSEFAQMLSNQYGYYIKQNFTQCEIPKVPDTIADNVYQFDAESGSDAYVVDLASGTKCKYSFTCYAIADGSIILEWLDYQRNKVTYTVHAMRVGEYFILRRNNTYYLYLIYVYTPPLEK